VSENKLAESACSCGASFNLDQRCGRSVVTAARAISPTTSFLGLFITRPPVAAIDRTMRCCEIIAATFGGGTTDITR
ncbi:hypothetical protein FOZ63_033028, partial [Perkinsus olseni]